MSALFPNSDLDKNYLIAVDDDGLLGVLDGMLSEAGTQRALAAELNISTAYISDIRLGHRPIGAIAERLGYQPIVVYVAAEHAASVKSGIVARLVRGLIANISRSAA